MLGKMISSVVSGIGIDTARDNLVVGSDALWSDGQAIVDTAPSPTGAWQTSQSHTGATQNEELSTTSGTGFTCSIETDGSGNPTFTVTAVGSGYSAGDTVVFTDPGSSSETATITLEEASTDNIVIGKDVLDSTTSLGQGADRNIGIGNSSLTALLTGDNNIAIGHEAMLTAGGAENNNVAIGYQSMSSVISNDSEKNVAIGFQSAQGGAAAMAGCIAIGYQAMNSTSGNAHTGTIAIGMSTLTALLTGAGNTAIGHQSLSTTDDGASNTAVGYTTLAANCGNNNTAVGYDALGDTTGASNTAVGSRAGDVLAAGASNVFMGSNAGGTTTAVGSSVLIGAEAGADGLITSAADGTVAVGASTLAALTDGAGNTAVGNAAGTEIDGGHRNTLVGFGAMAEDAGQDSNDNTFIGWKAGGAQAAGTDNWNTAPSSGNVGVGSSALAGAMNDAPGNVAVGFEAGKDVRTGDYNVAIGYQALDNARDTDDCVAIGKGAMGGAITTGTVEGCVAIGKTALGGGLATDADYTIGIGQEAGSGITSGVGNIAIGYQALDGEDDGDYNIAIGYQALTAQGGTTGEVANTVIGYKAALALTKGRYTTILGAEALTTEDVADDTTAIGYRALYSQNGGGSDNDPSGNVALGSKAGYFNATGLNNTYLGHKAGYGVNTINHSGCVFIGKDAGLAAYSGANNIAIGLSAMDSMGALASTENIFIGKDSGGGSWTGNPSSYNVAIGNNTMDAAMNGAGENVAIGYSALSALTSGDENVSIGLESSIVLTTGSANTIIGAKAGSTDIIGSGNVAVGKSAFNKTYGSSNVAIGREALEGATFTDGSCDYDPTDGGNERVIGHDANAAIIAGLGVSGSGISDGAYIVSIDSGTQFTISANTTGGGAFVDETLTFYSRAEGTVAVGKDALTASTFGTGNTAIGYQAGNLVTSGGQNTFLGYDADVDTATRAGCVIIGSGLSLNTASDNVVEIGNNTNSMTYDLDGGDITVTSDIRTKTNINDTELGLAFINKLRPITYESKPTAEYPKEFNISEESKKDTGSGKVWDGLIAQEVKAVMDEMDVDFSGWEEGVNTKQRLAYGKFVMPLIKAIQELSAEVEKLKNNK